MTKIFLLRHGESIKTETNIVLSDKGKRQAELLAKRLAKINITKVYVSNDTRVLQTYKEFKKLKPKIPCVQSEKLKEIYRVIIGGPERTGTAPERELDDRKRAGEILKEILTNAKEKDALALFIHGNLIRYFISKFLRTSGVNLWEVLVINDASISLIEIIDNSPKIKMINNIEHLEEKEVENFYNQYAGSMNYFS